MPAITILHVTLRLYVEPECRLLDVLVERTLAVRWIQVDLAARYVQLEDVLYDLLVGVGDTFDNHRGLNLNPHSGHSHLN